MTVDGLHDGLLTYSKIEQTLVITKRIFNCYNSGKSWLKMSTYTQLSVLALHCCIKSIGYHVYNSADIWENITLYPEI